MEIVTKPERSLDKARAEKRREEQRSRAERVRTAGRDIGDIVEIFDVARRESCRYDLRRFCEEYNPRAFYLGWSSIHLDAIQRLEESVLQGAMYAFAMPRGSGKTTISRMAALWAISYAHCRYIFMIGATGPKAEKLLGSIKMWVRFLPDYALDFPEISQSAIELKGRGNAANGQLCNQESTLITWAKDEYVLPTVAPPPNLDLTTYPNYVDSKGVLIKEKALWAPTSGSRIKSSGITGEGIRGAVETTVEGDELRPDLVLPDDPQTDVSAGSAKQNQDRYELVTGAILGMAGPDKTLSMVMPCTKIKAGDMVSVILDRKRNPLFRGSCRAMLEPMPENLEAWEPYFEKYQYGAQLEPPSYADANNYYLENRRELDQDSVATWPDRFKKHEVSAIQSAMNLYCLDPKAFFAEYQNNPQDHTGDLIFLTSDEITKKQSNYGRLEVPSEVQKITAFVDVQQELLFYGVVGWSDKFNGHVLEYSTYPKQQRIHFYKQSLPLTLSSLYPKLTEDARTYQALKDVQKLIFDLVFDRSDMKHVQVDVLGIDQRYKTTVIKQFVRDSKDSRIVPCFGGKWTGTEKPMNHPDFIEKWTTGGRRLGPNWRMGDAKLGVQSLEVNPNFWKTFLHEGLATPMGEAGCISLFQQEEFRHSLLANHLTAEFREQIESKWGKFDIWKVKPGNPDNDFLDVMYNCCALASYEGITAVGLEEVKSETGVQSVDWDRWSKRR